MTKIGAAMALAFALSGCVSLSSLETETPVYTGSMAGNYYDLAECAKAKQSKAVPMIRIELLHDKAAKEATVTWNHEFGAINAFVFKAEGPERTKLAIYAASALGEGWINLTKSCEQV